MARGVAGGLSSRSKKLWRRAWGRIRRRQRWRANTRSAADLHEEIARVAGQPFQRDGAARAREGRAELIGQRQDGDTAQIDALLAHQGEADRALSQSAAARISIRSSNG